MPLMCPHFPAQNNCLAYKNNISNDDCNNDDDDDDDVIPDYV